MPFCFQKNTGKDKTLATGILQISSFFWADKTPVTFFKAGPSRNQTRHSETLPQSLGALRGQIAFAGRTTGQN